MTGMKNSFRSPVDLIACADNPGILPFNLKKLRKDRTTTLVLGLILTLVGIPFREPVLISFGLVLVLRFELLGGWIQHLLLIQHQQEAKQGDT